MRRGFVASAAGAVALLLTSTPFSSYGAFPQAQYVRPTPSSTTQNQVPLRSPWRPTASKEELALIDEYLRDSHLSFGTKHRGPGERAHRRWRQVRSSGRR